MTYPEMKPVSNPKLRLQNPAMEKYDLVIGLEVHAQLNTKTKLFCADPTLFGSEPNSQVSEVSLAYPGSLPVINETAIEFAIMMGLACNCQINSHSWFDRKNYFYPDLPKGYQISQDASPICLGGEVIIRPSKEEKKSVRLNRIHLEEDAGKSIHEENGQNSLIDLNRAGIPLIEIVTEPEIFSSGDAYLVLYELRKLVRYLGICDGNMEEGSLRCDANVSIKPKGQMKLGNKVEIKNMNSLRFLQKAIDFEFQRQVGLMEAGIEIISETRLFHPEKGETFGMRSKETQNDYRYFPDPDLPPIIVTKEILTKLGNSLPQLPENWYHKFAFEYNLPHSDVVFLTENRTWAEFFEELATVFPNYKSIANWLMGPLRALSNGKQWRIEANSISIGHWVELFQLVDENQVSFSSASQILLTEMLTNPGKSPRQLAAQLNLIQDNNEDELKAVVIEILERMPEKVREYKNGKKGLIGMFMGEVKKATGGKADPKLAMQILESALT